MSFLGQIQEGFFGCLEKVSGDGITAIWRVRTDAIITPSGTQDVNLTKVGGTAVTLGQKTMAASIPVVLASDESALPISAASLPLPTGASTLAEQQTQTASLSVLDDWDESDRAKVNTIAGQVGVQGGAGAATALTQRVALATDANTIQGTVTSTPGTPTALTAAAPTAATVGTSSATAVAANASRKGLVLVNTSANTISLGFGATAVLNSGITLIASGGTFVMDERTFTVGTVTAIASAVSSNLSVQEFS